MHGISVYRQRTNGNVIFFEGIDESIVLCFVCKELGRVALCFSGVTARTQLNGMYAEGGEGLQSLFERLVVVKIRQYT